MSSELDDFDTAVLEEAWSYLQRDNIELATKLERAVKAGTAPKELSRRYLGIAGEHREAYARRIENAARYIQAAQRQQA